MTKGSNWVEGVTDGQQTTDTKRWPNRTEKDEHNFLCFFSHASRVVVSVGGEQRIEMKKKKTKRPKVERQEDKVGFPISSSREKRPSR